MHKLVLLTFEIFAFYPSFLSANNNLEIISKTIKENNVTIKGIRDERWSQITDDKINYPDMYSYFTEYQKMEPITLNSLNYYKNKKFSQVDVYRKIPYAKNYSDKRFQKSELFDVYIDWPQNYIHDGTKAGPICIQDKSNSIWKDDWFADDNEYGKEFKNEEFGLDCLSLDIYQPVIEENRLLPVWIYIHGGTYQIGSSQEYDCRFLAATQNIICVVIQYRLGVYGFFTTKSYSPGNGNYGLFDQRLAIKFVYNNIELFGGDNNDINIFGQSAGGSSVAQQLQYSARQKNSMVYTGMMESGAADSYWGISDHWKLDWWMKATHDFLIFYNETSGYQPESLDWSNDTQKNQHSLESYFINLDPETYMELTTKVLTYNAFILSNTNNSTLTIACPLLALPVYDNDFIIAPAYDDESIDWSNFSKIYGTLNAEGALIFWKGESKEKLIENDILMLFFDKYSEMEGKKCYQNQKSNQEILNCLQNVSDQINYWLQNGLNSMPKEIQNWISVAISSLKLLYLDSTYGEANKTYIENNNISDLEQFLNKIGTDVGYQIGQMRDLIKFTKNNNNKGYKIFNIQKNLDNFLYRFAPQQSGLIRCSSEDGSRNSVYKGTNFAYHGDDVFYLFGWVFCDDYYPCRLPCSSSISDKNAALELIDFVFRGEFVVQSDNQSDVENLIDSGAEFMTINENGIGSKESGFWKGKFRLYFELLDSIYESADVVDRKENCESSGLFVKFSFVSLILINIIGP